MPTHITPTIGRIVWYYPSGYDTIEQGDDLQPLAAMVCYVWPDGAVNLAVHDLHGYPWTRSRVRLVQEGEALPGDAGYATWMPYQVNQAAKAAAQPVPADTSIAVTPDGVILDPQPAIAVPALNFDDPQPAGEPEPAAAPAPEPTPPAEPPVVDTKPLPTATATKRKR